MPKLDEILAEAGKTLGVRRIYGEPYEKNGLTVITAARVMGGAGGGGAVEAGTVGATDATADSSTGAAATGSGIGFGMTGGPVGAFVIKGDEVKWVPAIDVNRLMLGFQIAFVVFFLVMRSMAKTRAKSKLEVARAAR